MKYILIKKSLTFAITLLFISVAAVPSIYAIENEEELVEITVEFYGFNGVKLYTVKLTREKADELEQFLKDIKTRLDAAGTREDAKEIFEETLEELYRYGLLKDITIEYAQRFLMDISYLSRFLPFYRYFYGRHNLNYDDSIINQYCLIVAYSWGEIEEYNLFYYLAIFAYQRGKEILYERLHRYSQSKHFRIMGTISMYGGSQFLYSIGRLGVVSGEYEYCTLLKFTGINIRYESFFDRVYIGYANTVLDII